MPAGSKPSVRASAAQAAPLAEGCPDVVKALDLSLPALLEASAGTGKTYAIEHLVLRLLTERGLELEEILVLTFTKKAAGELKEKIRNRLATRLHEGADLPPALKDRLREAWLNFDRAGVHTIHGFCERVLRNYAFENRALFAHERADDSEILQKVLAEEMRSTWLSPDCPGGEGLEGFRRLAQRLNFGPSGKWKDKVLGLARAFNPYRGDRLLPAWDPSRAEALEADARAALDSLLEAAGDAPAGGDTSHPWYLAAQAGSFPSAPRRKNALAVIPEILALVRAARDAEPAARPDLLRALLNAHARKDMVRESFALLLPQGGAPPSFRAMAEALDRGKRALAALKAESQKREYDAERKVVEAVQREARAWKRKRGILGFDDMIENLCEALEGPDLVRVLRQRYRCCIVDEFQDTDPLQWRIFRKVFLESEGANPLYLIGDPKQAIYGFRGGDIHTYLEARQALFARSREGKAAGLSLDANFRSSRAMVEACNAVFDHPRWFRLQGPVPGDEAWRLAPEADPLGFHPVKPGGRPVQECRETPEDGRPPAPVVLADFGHLAVKKPAQRDVNRWIAAEILALLAAPERLQVPDRGTWRPLDWGDICVLTRTNTEIRLLEAEFRRRGIPFQIHKRTGLWQSDAATEFLALLESLEDPRDAGRHARALLTRFFRAPGEGPASAPAEVHPAFEGWLGLASRRRWQKLFHALLYGTGLLHRACLEGDGDRRVMDYLHVGQNLVQEALRENLSLPALVQRLRDLRLETPDPDDERHLHREDSESRKVALMTYHISKGLEFPVVFLAGLAGSQADDVHRYHKDGHTEFNLDKGDREAERAAREEAEQEERRLYYVALTRPRFRLYVPLPAPQFGAYPCPLGGFVAEAVRSAADRRPDLFRRRTAEELQALRNGLFRGATATAAAPVLVPGNPRAPGTAAATPGTASPAAPQVTHGLPEIPAGIPAGFPPGPSSAASASAWAGPEADFPPGPSSAASASAWAGPEADFPGDFPKDPALSGPAADFSRRRRTLASYSHLVRRRSLETAEVDGRYDKDDAPAEPEEADGDEGPDGPGSEAPARPGVPGNALPRGREVGNMFHEILEEADFALVGAADSHLALLDHAPTKDLLLARLAEHRVEETHLGDVARVLWNALRAPIPDVAETAGGADTGAFRFADLAHRRHEMEFLFPYPPEGGAGEGYLWGYIDLVFRRGERYYILDWKSNWLEDYGPRALEADILASRYDLQYMLYSMALDRWLRSLVPGYDPARHLGGVYYVYLRGLDAAAPPGSAGPGRVPGVFAVRPTPRQVAVDFPAHLDKALGRRTP